MVEARRAVAGVLATVEDVGIVEGGNPFWFPLFDETDGQLATLHGSTDGVTWTATAQADRVKIAPRKYERGWARLIAFEAGFFTTDSGMAARQISAVQRTAFDHWPSQEEDLAPVLERAARAALRSLEVLERSRWLAQRLHKQSEPALHFADLTLDQQLREVARVYMEAAALGIRAKRGQVEAVLGIPTRTATRRIEAARAAGLIKEDSE